MEIKIRPTGVLVEENRILILKQSVSETRKWSLPGGALEPGETIEQCLIREMKEETGLDVKVKELLYICDRYRGMNVHIVHMSFLLERTGRKPGEFGWTNDDPNPTSSSMKTRQIKMTPIDELTDYGFSPTFQQLVKAGFPGRGSYKGDYHTFYGEPPPNERG
ncbi:MAG: NUDIX hydrolase [Dehalococcoidales bacterium]|nr:NUDIX hydrolase [Dehalococcoidales bacterium]